MNMPVDTCGATIRDNAPKQILNSSMGISNTIPKEKMFEFMSSTFHSVAQQLSNHCGPLSKFALVVSPSAGKYETNIFTKDGRNIINMTEFASPMEEIFKEMLLYIASRVDNVAGDGTTSSMILSARFFELIAKKFKDEKINSRNFRDLYNKFHEIMMEQLDNQKVTVDDVRAARWGNDPITDDQYKDMIGYIAACQAMSSSGGDVELSKAIFEIYRNSPENTWSHTDIFHSKYETGPLYSVDTEKYDFTLDNAQIYDQTVLNYQLGTEYRAVSDLVVIPEAIHDSGGNSESVRAFLNEIMTQKRKRNLVIISKELSNTLRNIISDFNARSEDFKIIPCAHLERNIPVSSSPELVCLSLAGGVEPYMMSRGCAYLTEAYIIPEVDVRYAYNRIFVNGLFKHACTVANLTEVAEDSVEHPFFTNPDVFPPFTEYLNILKQQVESYKTNVNQNRFMNTIDAFEKLISVYCTPRRPKLYVAGSSHDHAAAIDVIRDVCGAVNSSLRNGFVVGSSFALARCIESIDQETKDVVGDFMFAIHTAVSELIHITANGEAPKSFENDAYALDQIDFIQDTFHIDAMDKFNYINLIRGCTQRDFSEEIKTLMRNDEFSIDKFSYPIIQPTGVFEQLFKRIGDLMIKLITTESMIVPGSVYIDTNEE